MPPELQLLIITAITVSCLHTLAGPDHYLPFIALSKSRGWSLSRTLLWTLVCGCGHVWSSVLLALGGAALGWTVSTIKGLESVRGGVAAWALLLFGLVYSVWGAVRAGRKARHRHFDLADDGAVYVYEHKHGEAVAPKERHAVTPWVMFLVFVLGPCEPMIPLLYFPAAKSSWWYTGVLIAVYTLFTLISMLVMVLAGYYGFSFFRVRNGERYMHFFGGLTIFICGAGMVFMDW